MREFWRKTLHVLCHERFVTYVSVVLMFVAGVMYTNYVSHKICVLVEAQGTVYQKEPPTTETGLQMARKVNEFVERECK